MIFDVLDEELVPQLSVADRLILVLYDLGIATREQIAEISGWSETRIKGAIQRVRNFGEDGEKDDWIRSWQPKKNQPRVYALGERGIEHARALRGEYADARKRPLQGHVYHFVGLNQILCRLVKAFGRENVRWLSGKEAASLLYHRLRTGEEDGQRSPLRPDAMVEVGGKGWWAVEYDCATETSIRLEEKFRRYLQLAEMVIDLQVLFVTVSERRRQQAEWIYDQLRDQLSPIPEGFDIAFLVEGEEPDFLRP